MKKHIFPFFICFACLLTGSLILIQAGCGTNAPTKIAQGEGVAITSVNAGVKQIVSAINAGKLTHAQCDDFNTAYDSYYGAQQILKAVIEKMNAASPTATTEDIANAQSAVDSAEKSLLAIINKIVGSIH